MPYKKTDFNKIKSSHKHKHFLSLNNRASWPRQGLFYFFQNYDLLDKSYLSYHGNITRTPYASLSDIDQIFFLDEFNKIWYTQNVDFAESKKIIPFSTIPDGFLDNCWGIGNTQYYEDCFCSVVTETYCFEDSLIFDEKMFKPIVFFQPFLVHCNRNGLKKLRDLGFKTFSQWWDESYDDLFDHRRFEAMLKVALEISQWSLDKVNAVYQEMTPVLEHNHNHFTKVLPELYNAEITQVKNQIADIIQSRT
jgi:hypothetical protein